MSSSANLGAAAAILQVLGPGNEIAIKQNVGPLVLEGHADYITPGTAASGTLASEQRLGVTYRLRYTLTSVGIAMTDNGANGGNGSLKLGTFPQGFVRVQAAIPNLTLAGGSGLTATSAIVAALGTTAASNANATLTTTEADILPSTACTLSSSAGTFNTETAINAITVLDVSAVGTANNTLQDCTASYSETAVENNFADVGAKINEILAVMNLDVPGKAFDGTTTAKEIYLNFATPDAGITATTTLTVSGTIDLVVTVFGDN